MGERYSALNLTTANNYARHIVTWLTPFCDRIEIAGSIRRQRPECADVDLVVIPKRDQEAGLFETRLGASQLYQELVRYVTASGGRARWVVGENNPDGKQHIVQLPKCQLDIYTATPDNWGSVLVCRTGSKDHNAWCSARARFIGKEWKISEGIQVGSELRKLKNEHTFYAELGLDYIPPTERDGTDFSRWILVGAEAGGIKRTFEG